jgi:hypothetical protein
MKYLYVVSKCGYKVVSDSRRRSAASTAFEIRFEINQSVNDNRHTMLLDACALEQASQLAHVVLPKFFAQPL